MTADILLLDDDAVQGNTRKAILERAGYAVAIASDGRAALSFLQSPEGPLIRMVVTDHAMPGMSGPQFVAALRKAGWALPVLVLSGFADVDDEYESLNVTCRMKPLPPDQLIAFVKYNLDASERRTA